MFCDENVSVVCMVNDKLSRVVFRIKNVLKVFRLKSRWSKHHVSIKGTFTEVCVKTDNQTGAS